MTNQLLQTIETDLAAGVSYLEHEAEDIGLQLWNSVKAVFIALEPAEAQVLATVLQAAVTAAQGGKSIEEIETSALNTATQAEKAVLLKAGSGISQTLIAALKASPSVSVAPVEPPPAA